MSLPPGLPRRHPGGGRHPRRSQGVAALLPTHYPQAFAWLRMSRISISLLMNWYNRRKALVER